MEQTAHQSEHTFTCPQCNEQWSPPEVSDDTSFYTQENSEHSIGTLSTGVVREGAVVVHANSGNTVITGFCSPACQCDWLNTHGSDQLRRFTPTEAEKMIDFGALCHECGQDSYQRSEDGEALLEDEMGNRLICESDTRYFIANGFYGSPVDGGASFCDRQGIGCILKYFEKQKGAPA